MDHDSLKDIATSAPAIYAAVAAGSAAVGVYVYERYFSENSLRRAELRKDVRLAREETKREKETTKQQEIASKTRELDRQTALKQMEYGENQEASKRTRELIELKAAKKKDLLETQLSYLRDLAGRIVEIKEVLMQYTKDYAIAAATVDNIKAKKREELRDELYGRIDLVLNDRRSPGLPIDETARKIIDEEEIYSSGIIARVERVVNAKCPIVDGMIPPLLEEIIRAIGPDGAIKKIQESLDDIDF